MLVKWWKARRQAKSRQTLVAGRRQRGLVPSLELLESRETPAAHTWQGSVAGPNTWSTATNWVGNNPPTLGEPNIVLNFPANPQSTISQDDLNGLLIDQLNITGTGYTITNGPGPGPFTLAFSGAATPSFTDALGGNQFSLSLTLNLTGINAFQVDAGLTTIQSPITGTGGLTKTGPGTLQLGGNGGNTYGGLTTVNLGALELFKTGGLAVPNDLVVGSAGGAAGSAKVLLRTDGQVSGTAQQIINSSGEMTLDSIPPLFSLGIVTINLGRLTGTAQGVPGNLILNGTLALNGGVVNMGRTITLTNGISVGTTSGGVIQDNLDLGSVPQTFIVNRGAVALDLDIQGSIAGIPAGLIKTGPGTLRLGGADTYTGATTINGGVLFMDGTNGASQFVVNSGATLGGAGLVGSIAAASGSIVSPGNGPGILGAATSIGLGAGSTFRVELNGTVVGTEYDQLATDGNVSVSDASLNSSLGFVPKVGDTFTIIDNNGVNPVTGTFLNLPEGATPVIGGRQFGITYVGGTGNDVQLKALLGTTSTSLVSSANPSVTGQPLTLTATVTPTAGLSGTPTGTVTFFANSQNIGTGTLNAQGQASISYTPPGAGTFTLEASYGGDALFATSLSPNVPQTVNRAGTTTQLASSQNPSVVGQNVVFTATVAVTAPGAGTPTGNVSFLDGGQPIGSGQVGANGQATFATSNLSVGAHNITAVYSGDINFTSSNGGPVNQAVNRAATTTQLVSAVNPSTVGQPVTFTATVAATAPGAGTPSGNVSFLDGGQPIGSGQVANGQATFTTSNLTGGSHTITAVYSGDNNFNSSNGGPITQVVNRLNSSTTLTAAPNPSTLGQTVTLSAQVSGSQGRTPTGAVFFRDGQQNLGSVAVDANGAAQFTTAALAIGGHSLTAVYGGDSSYSQSVSQAVAFNVNKADTTTVLSAPSSAVVGQPVTFTATVATTITSPAPTGAVTFVSGALVLGTANLTNGTATLTVSNIPVGSYNVVASYGGDGNFNVSSSAPAPLVVNKGSTTTQLSSAPNPAAFGQPVTFTATVFPTMQTSVVPTGSVTFLDGTTHIGTAPVVISGIAQLTVNNLAVGTHAITAQFSGDANFAASASTTLTQTITGGAAVTPFNAFVQQLYLDVLLRPFDPAGLQFWVAQLQAGATRADVSAAFWVSLEHQALEIEEFYHTFLNRSSDAGGKAFWLANLRAGVSESDIVIGFVLSPEYTAQHPTNSSYVQGLYLDVFRRSLQQGNLTQAEIDYWAHFLNTGERSRADIAFYFLSSGESFQAAITTNYFEYLNRNPSGTDRAGWFERLAAGLESPLSFAVAFLASDEFFVLASQRAVAGGGIISSGS